MWWTRLLSGVVILFCFLLLIIPGVYVATRLCFVETIVVAERDYGIRAMSRSFEITKNRFWRTFGFCFLLIVIVVRSSGLAVLPTVLIPAFDHWMIDAASQLVCDVIMAFGTVALFCAYEAFTNENRSV